MVLASGNLFSTWNNFLNCAHANLATAFMKDTLTLDLLKDGVGDSSR